MRTARYSVIALLSLLLLVYPSSATARGEFRNIQDTRFKIDLGGMASRFDSSLLLKPQTGPAALYLDMENDVGLDSITRDFRIGAFYRIGDRHRIYFQHFQFNRSSGRVIDRIIEIGDNIWEINTLLSTVSRTSLTELAYMYSLIQDGKFELSGLAGFHWLRFESNFTGVNNGNEFVTETASLQGPLPVIGLDVSYAVNSRLNLLWRSELFAIQIDKYGGRLSNHYIAVEYFLWRNMGIGVGFNDFNLDVKVDDDKKIGEIEAAFKGFLVYLTARF